MPLPNPLTDLDARDVKRKKQSTESYTKMKSAVLRISPSLVAVSSFKGVQRMIDCSGLVIAWKDRKDEQEGEALILTSAKVVRVPDIKASMYRSSQIIVAKVHAVDFYNNMAVLKVCSTENLRPVVNLFTAFGSDELVEGLEVVALGRDFLTSSLLSSSGSFIPDYPYFGCEELTSSSCKIDEVSEGGPLLDYSGRVLGINFHGHAYAHPLLTTSFHESLTRNIHGDTTFQQWLGFSVVNSRQLPLDTLTKLNISKDEQCILVKEVFDGSSAKRAGIEPGDCVVLCTADGNVKTIREYRMALKPILRQLKAHDSLNIPVPIATQQGRNSRQIELCDTDVIPVSDEKFCCLWPMDQGLWSQEPLYGSQSPQYQDFGGCFLGHPRLHSSPPLSFPPQTSCPYAGYIPPPPPYPPPPLPSSPCADDLVSGIKEASKNC